MFKKSLLALSVAALSTSALAVNVTSTPLAHTNQGVQTADVITGAASVATLGAEYKVDDLITFTYSAELDETFTASPTINAAGLTGGPSASMTLGLLSQSSTTLTYRVTALEDTTSTIDATIDIPAPSFVGSEVRGSDAETVTYSATLSNGTTTLDGPGTGDSASAEVLTLAEQFATANTTSFDGVIDVEDDRQSFEGSVTADEAVFGITDTTTAGVNASFTDVTYTVNGDFDFLDTDDDTDGIQLGSNTVTATGTGTTAVTVTAETIVVTNDIAEEITLTITSANSEVLPTQTFDVDTDINYNDGSLPTPTAHSLATINDDLGAWTINGSQVMFPYAPIGYSHITTNFELSNSGTQNGVISVTAIGRDGAEFSGTLTQTAKPKSLTKIGQQDIYTALGLTSAQSLSVTIITAAPEEDIKVSGYSNLESGGRMALLSDAYETAKELDVISAP
jgi:hypothetical protein